MISYFGDFAEDDTVLIPFNTFSSDDPSASVTITNLADADIKVHKDASLTQIVTDGATVVINFDSITGNHMVTIDTSADAAYATGSEYAVRVEGTTVDGGTINAWIGAFSIERAGGALAVTKLIQAAVITNAAGDDVAADIIAIKAETATIVADTNELQGDDVPGLIAAVQSDTDDIQTRLPAALVGGLMSSDVTAISTDTTAADNLELQYDTTGLTGDTFPATQSQANATSASAGGSVNIAATHDNTITDTIDNAGAVDKGSGLVGIPVTGHAFIAGNEVTIAGTTNYNGVEDIVSQTTNEIVITASFVSETFGGSETIVSSIKGVVFVGSVQSGTFSATQAVDGVYHDIDDVGNVIDVVYEYAVGGGRAANQLILTGFAQGNGDVITTQIYDFVGADWETIGVITGANGTANIVVDPRILLKHTGTGSDLGKVYIRLISLATTPSNLSVDGSTISAVSINQTAGYQDGQVWVNTVGGTAGTEINVNGVADNAVLSIGDAFTIASALTLSDFHIINGSTITLTASTVNKSFFGDNWTLALGGQNIAGSYFEGSNVVTGVGVSAAEVRFDNCEFGTASVQLLHAESCSFTSTVTMTLAGDYHIINSQSGVAGAGGPTFTKTAGQTITTEWRRWSGTLTVSGLEAGDVITISGELGTVTLNGADASVEIRGTYKALVNNLTGSPTVNTDGAIKGVDVASTLADTVDIQSRLPAALVNSRMDSTIDATGFEDAAVDKVWDEALTGATHDVSNSAGRRLRKLNEGLVSTDSAVDDPGAAATTTVFNTDLTEVDDFWNDGVVVFTSGALTGQARPILDFANTNGQITLDEVLTSAPSNNDGFLIVATHIHPVSQIADGVWDEATSGHTTAGTTGKALSDVLVDTSTTLQGELDGIQADTEDIQSRLPAALSSGNMKSDLLAISTSSTAADNLEKSALQIIPGIAAGTPSTTVINTDLAGGDDIYIGRTVIFTSGAAINEATDITDFADTDGVLTVTALSNAPSSGDTFIII
jgi:hypothetical protein